MEISNSPTGIATINNEDGKIVQKTVTDITAREAAVKVTSDIPDDGLVAWLQVLGCFFLRWNVGLPFLINVQSAFLDVVNKTTSLW
jgi:hypothetical protein